MVKLVTNCEAPTANLKAEADRNAEREKTMDSLKQEMDCLKFDAAMKGASSEVPKEVND